MIMIIIYAVILILKMTYVHCVNVTNAVHDNNPVQD